MAAETERARARGIAQSVTAARGMGGDGLRGGGGGGGGGGEWSGCCEGEEGGGRWERVLEGEGGSRVSTI